MSKNKKVFIIDDRPLEVKPLRTYFSADYDVLPLADDDSMKEYSNAFNSIDTLESYVKRVIQDNYRDLRLIISDIFFDGDLKQRYDGLRLIRQIREWKILNAHPDYCKFIPIIATSKVTDKDYLYRAYSEAKATLYVDKEQTDRDGNILGLKDVSRQLIPLFDSWCAMEGVSRFKVAFSFTGSDKTNNENHRAFVREIAESLCRRCRISVFFDEFYKSYINTNSGWELSNIYRSQSENIVVFLSNEYNDPKNNVWTSDEWELGIKPYIKETGLDNLCLISLSDVLKENTVLPRLFSKIGPNSKETKGKVKTWNHIYQPFKDQRKYFYSLTDNTATPANQAFEAYYTTFRKEKLKTIVDFIIKRFNLTEVVPD